MCNKTNFKIGDTVVCIKSKSIPGISEGKKYVVRDVVTYRDGSQTLRFIGFDRDSYLGSRFVLAESPKDVYYLKSNREFYVKLLHRGDEKVFLKVINATDTSMYSTGEEFCTKLQTFEDQYELGKWPIIEEFQVWKDANGVTYFTKVGSSLLNVKTYGTLTLIHQSETVIDSIFTLTKDK